MQFKCGDLASLHTPVEHVEGGTHWLHKDAVFTSQSSNDHVTIVLPQVVAPNEPSFQVLAQKITTGSHLQTKCCAAIATIPAARITPTSLLSSQITPWPGTATQPRRSPHVAHARSSSPGPTNQSRNRPSVPRAFERVATGIQTFCLAHNESQPTRCPRPPSQVRLKTAKSCTIFQSFLLELEFCSTTTAQSCMHGRHSTQCTQTSRLAQGSTKTPCSASARH